jgi:hypothetical protein
MHDPHSLHKYLYVHGDPIQGVDPTGLFTLGSINVGLAGLANLNQMQADVEQGVLDSIDAAVEGISADQHVRNVLFRKAAELGTVMGVMVLAMAGVKLFSVADRLVHGFWFTRKHVRSRIHSAKRATIGLYAYKHIRATTREEARRFSLGLGVPSPEASYFPELTADIAEFEKSVAYLGARENQAFPHGGTIYVFKKLDVSVGYNNGRETRWIRIEVGDSPSATIHSFPANLQQVRNYIPNAKA